MPSPLEVILEDMRRAIDAGFHYLALSVALSVPDICSSAELKREPGDKIWKGTQTRYVNWCEEYLMPQFQTLTAVDVWALRGGVIHNGKLHGHPAAQYDRIVFMLPAGRNLYHECVSRDNGGIPGSALQLDLELFCRQMIIAAHSWLQKRGSEPVVAENLANLVRLRPQGIAPHFVGMPVIA